jgi:DNA repair protein RadA/Sms
VARLGSRFVCQSCGAVSTVWEGRCHVCGTWDSLVETVAPASSRGSRGRPVGLPGLGQAVPRPLHDVATRPARRLSVGIQEVDRVLGGGLVPGALVLLGGEPGIGKSTLVLEIAAGVARCETPGAEGHPDGGTDVLYASGEESADQLHLRADRLGLTDGVAGSRIQVIAETGLDAILAAAEAIEPGLLVVDSVQTLTTDGLEGPAGSVGQVRESAARLAAWSHEHGTPVILVGHVTKDGSLAGPRTLEHLVDVVLVLEGDRYGALRLLRGAKNRFGSTEETGVLEMTGEGLRDVPDPARAFLGAGGAESPGVVVAATMEGTRPILVEVQALVASAGIGMPRRALVGVPADRLALLVAVLGRRCGLDVANQDLYVSLVGGATVNEPALDLAVALALASTARDVSLAPGTVACGEVSLLGSLRPVQGLERRLREAARLGFRQAIVPAGDDSQRLGAAIRGPGSSQLRIIAVETLREALARSIGAGSVPSG